MALPERLRTNVCASQETLDDLALVLTREKFDCYFDPESHRSFVSQIRRNVHLFDVRIADLSGVEPPCRDPNDKKFLALALVSEADISSQ